MNVKRTYVYIDDVVISVKLHNENLSMLQQVFNRFHVALIGGSNTEQMMSRMQ